MARSTKARVKTMDHVHTYTNTTSHARCTLSFQKWNERKPVYEIITLDSRPDFLPLEKFNQRRSSSCLFDETPNIPRPNEQTQYRIDETRYKKKRKEKKKRESGMKKNPGLFHDPTRQQRADAPSTSGCVYKNGRKMFSQGPRNFIKKLHERTAR